MAIFLRIKYTTESFNAVELCELLDPGEERFNVFNCHLMFILGFDYDNLTRECYE